MNKAFLLLPLILMACSSSPQIVYKLQCPSIVPYTQASQNKLKQELQAYQNNQEIIRYLNDYARLRNSLRACQQNKS